MSCCSKPPTVEPKIEVGAVAIAEAEAGCGMMMYFNGQINGFYLLFSSWTIGTPASLALACLACFLMAVGYELFKHLVRRVTARVAARCGRNPSLNSGPDMKSPCSAGGLDQSQAVELGHSGGGSVNANSTHQLGWFDPLHLLRSFLYGLQVCYAFVVMLVVMTYNTYLVAAVCLGAMIGTYLFGRDETVGSQSAACH
ncbi:copper transpport protein [Dimargaris cristalligena]|nr:copper transpport protein [Dimargaris cristalligena]